MEIIFLLFSSEVDNYEFNLFKDLLPNEMKLLNNEEAEGYLPKLKRSMAIKYSNEARNEWNYFQRFEGKVKNGWYLFFFLFFELKNKIIFDF